MSTSRSKFALSGFGRSTKRVGEDEKALKKGQEMLTVLERIITLEKAAQKGADVSESLGIQQNKLRQFQEATKQRTSALGQDIIAASSGINASKFGRGSGIKARKGSFNLKTRGTKQYKAPKMPTDGIKFKKNLAPKIKNSGILRQDNKFGARRIKSLTN